MLNCCECTQTAKITFRLKDYCWFHYDQANLSKPERKTKAEIAKEVQDAYDGTYLIPRWIRVPTKEECYFPELKASDIIGV